MGRSGATCAKAPCRTCPYRRDVPSGLWSAEEYEKLPGYDGETWEQSFLPFNCHQNDGKLCAGWIACHDTGHLLALRILGERVDPAVFSYQSPVPVFSSGAEAAAHGMAEIDNPSAKAKRMILSLMRKAVRQGRP